VEQVEDGNQYEVPPKLQAYLSPADLEAIASAVHEGESRTAGEIRVHINEKLLPFQSPRKQAIRVFRQLGMDQTKARIGVLMYVTIRERRFEIITDDGVNAVVEKETWEKIARNVREQIKERGLGPGICVGIAEISEILAIKLPRKDDDVDELPNKVSFDSD
jgi:uncharacterized membrane protein